MRSTLSNGAEAEIWLPRPPRNQVRLEPAAVVEPALRDVSEFRGPDLDAEPVVFHGDVARELYSELEGVARDAALADDRVRNALGERYTIVGVSVRDDDKERREPARAVLVAYRYDTNRTVEVWLDVGGESDVTVGDVVDTDYQPPLSGEELERAIDLARGASERQGMLEADFEAMPILASDVVLGDLHYGRRRVVVGFGPPDERLPRVRVLVDLGAGEVLAVDSVAQGRTEEEGGAS